MNDRRTQECPLNEQAVGWALHALEPDEEMAVLLHLPQCLSCQTAVREAEEVLSGLGAVVEQVDPPPSLRDELLARVAETPQRPPLLRPRRSPERVPSSDGRFPGPSRHRSVPDTPPVPSRAVPPGPERPSWLSLRGRRLVAASLALVGVLTVGGLAVRTSQLEQQRDAEVAQAQSLADLMRQMSRPGASHALLAAPDGSTVAAVLVADGQRQVFTVGLPGNATDRNVYVLWGLSDGASPQALGTFDVAAADQGLRTVGTAAEAEQYSAYAISIEPGRTAPAAPTTQVASGAVQA